MCVCLTRLSALGYLGSVVIWGLGRFNVLQGVGSSVYRVLLTVRSGTKETVLWTSTHMEITVSMGYSWRRP